MKNLTVIPKLPVEYEEAVKALEACTHLDETKYWSDKSDALAAWAKIYHSPEAALKAKKLKLHAYRRMCQLAEEITPRRINTHRGSLPGARTLLEERAGLTRQQANAASKLAKLSEEEFQKALQNPAAPITVARRYYGLSEDYESFRTRASSLRGFCRQHDAAELGVNLDRSYVKTARSIAIDLVEWLDRFEQALPKEQR